MSLHLEQERTRRTPPTTTVPVQQVHVETGVDSLDQNQFNQPGPDSSRAETIHKGRPVMPSLMPSFSKAPPVQGRRLDTDPEAQGA